ncbi:glycosyl transferase family 2 [Sphingobium chlorophenolicum L-1]|uniref:Glycosyl transferase family 2 n=1 Tax=Sphingobium chlorophenolicum L-1 TaxID=690566 RepID=F6EWI1_SPHCR|nr:glycosyltransferase family 2 protein [Sphingobium chlorophenolicum]AEG48114.1 glycosyl transferase family 2 [Sphingobium chlorophenolicum L-1]
MDTDIRRVAEARSFAAKRGSDAAGAGQPWLSILVPVYNVLPYLEECLSSIIGQMDGDSGIELILLDDKSTDGSAELCAELIAGTGCNVRMMHHAENRGLSAARNSMLEAAAGDYLWFVDSDDKLLPGAVAALRDIVHASWPDVVLCDYVRDEAPIAAFAGRAGRLDYDIEALIAGTFANRRLHIWSRVWHRDLFASGIRFPEGACFEDMATVPWLMLRAQTYYYAAQPWVYYRSRPGSIMARISRVPRQFDVRRNDELASALNGFHHDLAHAIPGVGQETETLLGRFISREFFKISKRLLRSRQCADFAALRDQVARYRGMMEGNSPVPFSEVAIRYLMKGQVVRAAELWLALAVAGRRPANQVAPMGQRSRFA